MDLWERDDELGRLTSLAADAGHGAGHLVLVRGEAGIGTSTLVRAFVTREKWVKPPMPALLSRSYA